MTKIEAVLAVAKLRSFRAAATELGVSRSALSHAVAAIEADLDVRLFHRTTRSVSLTEAGEDFVAEVGPAMGSILGAIEKAGARQSRPSGTLRINASVGAARQLLVPIILDYLKRYPAMAVDIVTDGRKIDIVREGFDAGVRLRGSVPQDMIAIPFGGDLRFALVGSPAYFATHPKPTSPNDLPAHRCIRSRLPNRTLDSWKFSRDGKTIPFDGASSLILDEPTLMLDAARAGVGLALLSEWNVDQDLATGTLIRVMDDWTPPSPGLALYYPCKRHLNAGLRTLVDLIKQNNRTAQTPSDLPN